MTTIGHLTRLKLVVYSGIAGWCVGFLASLPADLLIGLRDSQGDGKLLATTMIMGLAVWSVWTLLLAGVAWIFFAVPCVLILPPAMLVRLRTRVLRLTTLLSLAISFALLYGYRDQSASKIALRFALLLQYGSFATGFAIATAWLYLRMAQRILLSQPSR